MPGEVGIRENGGGEELWEHEMAATISEPGHQPLSHVNIKKDG